MIWQSIRQSIKPSSRDYEKQYGLPDFRDEGTGINDELRAAHVGQNGATRQKRKASWEDAFPAERKIR
jgi:hypothetical protein